MCTASAGCSPGGGCCKGPSDSHAPCRPSYCTSGLPQAMSLATSAQHSLMALLRPRQVQRSCTRHVPAGLGHMHMSMRSGTPVHRQRRASLEAECGRQQTPADVAAGSHVYGAWRPHAQAVRDVLLADEAGPVHPTLRQGKGRLIPLRAATCLSRSRCCLVHNTGPFTAPSLTFSSRMHRVHSPVSGCSQMLLDTYYAWPQWSLHKPSTGLHSCKCSHAAPRPHGHPLRSHNYLREARRQHTAACQCCADVSPKLI